jgi:hypothetical protein
MTAYSPHGVTNMTNHEIFVDAGCIWIGDPSYIMGQDADFHVNNWLDDFAIRSTLLMALILLWDMVSACALLRDMEMADIQLRLSTALILSEWLG